MSGDESGPVGENGGRTTGVWLGMRTTDIFWGPRPVCADARLRAWLVDRGSLPRRIQSRCAAFRLNVLSQRMAPVRRVCALMGEAPRLLGARRSLFVLRGSPLLVTEVFLPAILALAP